MGVESGAIEMGPALSSLSMGSYRGARAHPYCTANTACARKRANGRCGAAGESRATWGCYMRSQGRGVGWLGRNARRSEPRLMCVALARGCKSFWLRRTRPPSLWAGKKGGSRYGTVSTHMRRGATITSHTINWEWLLSEPASRVAIRINLFSQNDQ